jgi:hypothetical protein
VLLGAVLLGPSSCMIEKMGYAVGKTYLILAILLLTGPISCMSLRNLGMLGPNIIYFGHLAFPGVWQEARCA